MHERVVAGAAKRATHLVKVVMPKQFGKSQDQSHSLDTLCIPKQFVKVLTWEKILLRFQPLLAQIAHIWEHV
jgi:hypothetical protein